MPTHEESSEVRGVPAYTSDPVPEALLRETLDHARWAPSWHNPRGWHIWALTGDALQCFKDGLTEKLLADAPGHSDLEGPESAWPELCLLRTARQMAAHEEDQATAGQEGTREEQLTDLGRLFGAPCLLVYGVDCHVAGPQGCINSGAFVACMCHAAHDSGLSTCVLATAVKYPELLHELLPDHHGELFAVGVAVGYPDTDDAGIGFTEEPIRFDDLVSWVE